MKIKLILFFLLAHVFAFGQVPLPPGYEFTTNTGNTSGYIFMNYQSPPLPNQGNPSLMLFDAAEGHLVFFRPFSPDSTDAVGGTSDFKLLPNGKMAFFRIDPNQGVNAFNLGKYYLMDSSFNVIDTLGCDGLPTDGHEIQMTPSGNYLFLCTQDSVMDLSGLTINDIQGSDTSTVRGQGVMEVTPAGNKVWYADPFVHNNVSDMYMDNWDVGYNSDDYLLDWTHRNAIEYDNDGNLLVSSRHFNQVMKINRNNKQVMWRLGGKRNDFNTNDTLFTGQHDIRRLPNGNITLYNNAQFATVKSGRSMEFAINEVTKTASVVDEYIYKNTMISLAMGSHRKLPGNKTMVCYGANIDTDHWAQAVPRMVVVDQNDNLQLEFFYDDAVGFSYRAQYEATLPFALNRPLITVSNGRRNLKILDAGIYSDYRWSTGQTTRRITVLPGSDPKDYFCYVPKGEGFISTEIVTLGGSNKLAFTASLTSDADFQVEIFPNPSEGVLKVRVENGAESLQYRVLDVQGKTLKAGALNTQAEARLDLGSISAGMYFLELCDPVTGNCHRNRIVLR